MGVTVRISAILSAVVLTASLPLITNGHEGGLTVVDEVDGYSVSTTYSPDEPDELTTAAPVRFEFKLADAESGDTLKVTDAWVRVTKESKTFFAGGINQPEFGKLGMLYVFPEAGEFKVHVRFQNDGESIVENSIPISVAPAERSETIFEQFSIWWLLIGILGGGVLGAVSVHRARRTHA